MCASSALNKTNVTDDEARALVHDIGRETKNAAFFLSTTPSSTIDKILADIANGILDSADEILKANDLDIEYGKSKGLSAAMLDRLRLTPERIQSIAESVLLVKGLDD